MWRVLTVVANRWWWWDLRFSWDLRRAEDASSTQIWVGQLGSISGGETGSRGRLGSPSPIPTESAVCLLNTHSQTHTHLEGLLRLPSCDLSKMLIIANWTFSPSTSELFILFLSFLKWIHYFFSHTSFFFVIISPPRPSRPLLSTNCCGANLLCLIKLLPPPDES